LAIPGARQKSALYLIATFLFLSWFMGLRYFVGCDYHGYGIRFLQAGQRSIGDILARQEVSFELLTYLGATVIGSYNIFLLLASSIVAFLYLKFASAYSEMRFIVALFIPVLVIQLGMSGLRQAIAVGFICLAFNAFSNVQKLRCAGYILVAGSFHSSAFIFLPLALIAGRQFSFLRIIVAIGVLVFPAVFLLGERVDVYQDRYIDQIYGAQEASGAWIRFILTFLPVPFFLMRRDMFRRKYAQHYNILMLGALMIIGSAALGLISSVALHRILFYLMPLSILLAVCTLDLFRSRLQGKFMWITVYFGYMAAWFSASRHADVCYTPYQNITFFNASIPSWFTGF
jgi:hypothetical protein